MILCNLAAIMGERRLKISKVAADTGISRTTLTALYYDSGKGVQFETANLLCIYFGIGMGELFTTLPFDLFIEGCTFLKSRSCVTFDCKILTKKTVQFPELQAKLVFPPRTRVRRNTSETKMIFSQVQSNNSEEEIAVLNNFFAQLPETAKKVVEHRFFDALTVELKAKDDVTRDELDDFLFSSYTCEFPERFLGAIEI